MTAIDRFGDFAFAVGFLPLVLASHAPRGFARFIATILALPFCIVSMIISIPLLLVLVVWSIWDETT